MEVVCDFLFFKQKTAYEMRISDWSSDVCSSDLLGLLHSGTAVIRSKPQGRPTASGFSANHEYAVFWSAVEKPSIGRLPRKGSKAERYPYADANGIYSWANFRKSGTDRKSTRLNSSHYCASRMPSSA